MITDTQRLEALARNMTEFTVFEPYTALQKAVMGKRAVKQPGCKIRVLRPKGVVRGIPVEMIRQLADAVIGAEKKE